MSNKHKRLQNIT